MRRVIIMIILAGGLLLAAGAPAPETCSIRCFSATQLAAQVSPALADYHNSRYGFSIKYPASFTMEPPPENNDGSTFVSSDGKATLMVFGNFNVFDESLESAYKKACADSAKPAAYRTKGKNWFVISWKEKGMILYKKTYVGKKALNTFQFSYPEAQKERYDRITTRIEGSFSPGPLD
jgi:hypothetical protein